MRRRCLAVCLVFLIALGTVSSAEAKPDGVALYKQAWQIFDTQGQAAADAWVATLAPDEQAALNAVYQRDLQQSPVQQTGPPTSGHLPKLQQKPAGEITAAASIC